MERFVHRANLEHLRRLLHDTTDQAERRRIEKLIAEEEAKFPPPSKDDK